MIGSWSNRIIDESRCHIRDRHALDTSNSDVNYVTLRLALAQALSSECGASPVRESSKRWSGPRGADHELGVLLTVVRGLGW
jgi:hypothetical protein